MAIFWCDPYLNAPVNGIHGTLTSNTSSGDGSYSAPWSLTELCNSASYSQMTNGDELRLKGLAEDTFFPPAGQSTFFSSDRTTPYIAGTDYNGYYNPSIYVATANNTSLMKLKQQDRGTLTGRVFYYKSYSGAIPQIHQAQYWSTNTPPLNISYGYIPFDNNYRCNIDINGFWLRNITSRIKITAGWISESSQGGVTVIDGVNSSTFGSGCWGPDEQGEGNYVMPVWDCAESMIFARPAQSSGWYIFGQTVKLKAIADAEQNYSGLFIQSGSSNNTQTSSLFSNYNAGDIFVDTIASCNVILRNYAINGNQHLTYPTVDTQFITGYMNDFHFWQGEINGEIRYKLKELYGLAAPYFYPGSNSRIVLELVNNWNFERSNNSPSSFGFGSSASATQRQYVADNSIVGTQGDSYLTLAGWGGNYLTFPIGFNLFPIDPQNYGFKGDNTGQKLISGPGIFDKISYNESYQMGAYVENLDTRGVDLKDITISPLYWGADQAAPWTQKINVRHESTSLLPVTVLQPSGVGYGAILYNSPNFSYKKAIRFFPECNGESYADVVSYDMPSFSADVVYTQTYITTNTPGINIYEQLWLYNISTNLLTMIAQPSATFDGTTATVTYTMTSAELANKAGLLIVVKVFQKTSADVAEVAYNNVTLV